MSNSENVCLLNHKENVGIIISYLQKNIRYIK